ncbi:MAG: tetratricopeptide repeat protein [Acidobacteriota bacterium]|nr:tetratricopeptide repeat protein [Acidobacteriota bacterium]
MRLEPGSRLGSYEILAPLGAGGMGEVWRARDTRLQREVALKILPEAFSSDAERLSRFTREAHVLASLNHPGIGAIYSFEEIDGTHFLALELVPGETLKQRIGRGPIPLAEALGIARQIAEALEAAHGKGILHRDLKPANVIVTPDGRVKLLDFGLAKSFNAERASPDISQSPTAAADGTRQGLILGTASYMSPEQARGRPLDARSDLWSFGCLLYEMLAGRKAFDGETLSDILVAILDRDPNWDALPAAAPQPVRDLLHGLLEKDVDRRWRDVRDVKAALAGAFASHSTMQTHARVPANRRPLRWAVASGIAIAALLAAVLLRTRSGDGALPKEKYLAIMPFKDLSGQPDGQLVVDGLTESFRARLTKLQVPGLMVMAAAGGAAGDDAAHLARDRGANLVLTGALRRQESQIRLTYNILVAGSPGILAADEVAGNASDQFGLEDRLVESVAASLRVQLESAGAGAAARQRPSESEPYYRALGLLRRYDDPRSLVAAIEILNGISGGGRSALVQAALGRAWIERYRSTKDPAAAEAARAAVQRAIALDDGSPDAHLASGQLLAMTGKPKEAVVEIRRAIERQAPSADALLALGDALADAGDAAEAEATYRSAIALNPAYWAGYNKLGVSYFARGLLGEAEKILRQSIERNPEVGRVHNSLGAVLIQAGRFDEALKALRDSIARSPENPSAWSNLGFVHYYSGRYGEAADAFRRATALTPKSGALWANLGDALSMLPGREAETRAAYEEGLRLGREALAINPRNAKSQRLLSRCYTRIGNLAEASRWLDEAFKAEPSSVDNLFQRALLEHFGGHDEKAVVTIRRLVAAGYNPTLIRNEPAFGALLKDKSFKAALSKESATPVNAPTP